MRYRERPTRDDNETAERKRRFVAQEFQPSKPDDDCVFCCITEPGEACQRCGLPVPLKRVVGL